MVSMPGENTAYLTSNMTVPEYRSIVDCGNYSVCIQNHWTDTYCQI